jgi:hypothetical protein
LKFDSSHIEIPSMGITARGAPRAVFKLLRTEDRRRWLLWPLV